jgi:hypothetical protein
MKEKNPPNINHNILQQQLTVLAIFYYIFKYLFFVILDIFHIKSIFNFIIFLLFNNVFFEIILYINYNYLKLLSSILNISMNKLENIFFYFNIIFIINL